MIVGEKVFYGFWGIFYFLSLMGIVSMVTYYNVAVVDGTERSVSYNEEILRRHSREGTIICATPECHSRMVFRRGNERGPYFAHFDRGIDHEPETAEHLSTKNYLRDRLRRHPQFIEVQSERGLGSCRPDVSFSYDSKQLIERRFAIEVQHSPIRLRDMKEKIISYSKDQIYTIYIFDSSTFGKDMNNPRHTQLSEAERFWLHYWGDILYYSPDIHYLDSDNKERVPRIFRTQFLRKSFDENYQERGARIDISDFSLDFDLFESPPRRPPTHQRTLFKEFEEPVVNDDYEGKIWLGNFST